MVVDIPGTVIGFLANELLILPNLSLKVTLVEDQVVDSGGFSLEFLLEETDQFPLIEQFIFKRLYFLGILMIYFDVIRRRYQANFLDIVVLVLLHLSKHPIFKRNHAVKIFDLRGLD